MVDAPAGPATALPSAGGDSWRRRPRQRSDADPAQSSLAARGGPLRPGNLRNLAARSGGPDPTATRPPTQRPPAQHQPCRGPAPQRPSPAGHPRPRHPHPHTILPPTGTPPWPRQSPGPPATQTPGEHGQVTGSRRLHQSARPRLLQPANEHNPRPGSSSGQLPPRVKPTPRSAFRSASADVPLGGDAPWRFPGPITLREMAHRPGGSRSPTRHASLRCA